MTTPPTTGICSLEITNFRGMIEHGSAGDMISTIRSLLFQKPKNRPTDITDIDFAKAVAEWPVANNAVPADLRDLHVAVRQRVGRPAPSPVTSP
jgi:hypothetical protein